MKLTFISLSNPNPVFFVVGISKGIGIGNGKGIGTICGSENMGRGEGTYKGIGIGMISMLSFK